MASSIPSNPTSHTISQLLPKLRDADADIRFMTLNDIHQILVIGSPSLLVHDLSTCGKLLDGLLHSLGDSHGDVQNQAIKCLEPFVLKVPEAILAPTIDKVSIMPPPSDITIPALALRTIVLALPHPITGAARTKAVVEAYTAISKALMPRLLGRLVNNKASKGMIEQDVERGADSNSLDVLTEVARCYGPMLTDNEVEAIQTTIVRVLTEETSSPVLRKKAVVALSTLAPYFSDALLAHLVSTSIESLRQSHLTNQQRKVFLSIYTSLARAIPQKFGPFLTTLTPFALSPLSQLELDQQREAEEESGDRDVDFEEVREVALAALETFFQACAENMHPYTGDVVEATLRFLKYDPTLAEDSEDDTMDDDDDDDFEVEQEFEEDTGFEDGDDVSWKVRRGSVRTLHAVIASLPAGDQQVYAEIVPALLSRFKEREESVRDEVLATLTIILAKNEGTHQPISEHAIPLSRKRRRGGSDAFANESQQVLLNGYISPSTPPPSDDFLARISAEIVASSSRLLGDGTLSTRLAVIALLRQLVRTQRGGLTQIIDPLLKLLATETNNAFRVESLGLLQAIAESHSGRALQPYFAQIVKVLVSLAKDRYARTASEAFSAIESYIKAFTPPRSAASKSDNSHYLSQFQAVIVERIQDAETEVKNKAVEALGLLVGRTSGPLGAKLLSQSIRVDSQQIILNRMRNELTRLAAVRAFDVIAALTQTKSDCSPPLVNEVVLELGAQLRKASRSLRGASLSTLRALCVNDVSRACFTDDTVSSLVELLLPLIHGEDLHMLGPALVSLGELANDKPNLVAVESVNAALTRVAASSLTGSSFEALIACVTSLGRAGNGGALMNMLLQQGASGDIDVLGRVIGALLVASGDSSPVKLEDFIKELRAQADVDRQCLSLSVLGEAGLRMGDRFTMKPQDLIVYFGSPSEKVTFATAVALGRAGAGNVKLFLPQIIETLVSGQQYLALHSVKELLHHSDAEHEIKPLAQNLWVHIVNSGQTEDNKIVSAECIGRLAIIDPLAYLPQLQSYLTEGTATNRGMVIIALRYVFSDTDESYDGYIKDTIQPMLTTMLTDADVDNQRLALSAFNSAFQNKTHLVLPHLRQLMSSILPSTLIQPELVREVSMGPFKHKVDDGLEVRKSAYETVYVLLDQPLSRQYIDVPVLYDRVLAGIGDEHEIKIACCLILSKLISIAKEESARRLEALAQAFRPVLSFKPKDTAVKQELEKLAEHNKAIVKVSVLLNKLNAATTESRAWRDYFEWTKREFPVLTKAAEDEAKTTSV